MIPSVLSFPNSTTAYFIPPHSFLLTYLQTCENCSSQSNDVGFFLQEAKDLQKVSRLHPDDVLVFMMYPDGWPLNQHNIVLSAEVFFQGQCDECTLALSHIRPLFFWVTGFWLMSAYITAGFLERFTFYTMLCWVLKLASSHKSWPTLWQPSKENQNLARSFRLHTHNGL